MDNVLQFLYSLIAIFKYVFLLGLAHCLVGMTRNINEALPECPHLSTVAMGCLQVAYQNDVLKVHRGQTGHVKTRANLGSAQGTPRKGHVFTYQTLIPSHTYGYNIAFNFVSISLLPIRTCSSWAWFRNNLDWTESPPKDLQWGMFHHNNSKTG